MIRIQNSEVDRLYREKWDSKLEDGYEEIDV